MILSTTAWLFVAYYSIGLALLMEPIIIACSINKEVGFVVKFIAMLIAVSIWPIVFIKKRR